MYLPFFGGMVLCRSLFWYALLYVLSSFAIILTKKRELVALLLLALGCQSARGWSAVCDCGIS